MLVTFLICELIFVNIGISPEEIKHGILSTSLAKVLNNGMVAVPPVKITPAIIYFL